MEVRELVRWYCGMICGGLTRQGLLAEAAGVQPTSLTGISAPNAPLEQFTRRNRADEVGFTGGGLLEPCKKWMATCLWTRFSLWFEERRQLQVIALGRDSAEEPTF